MAEGLFRELGKGEWEAFSAGSKPSGYVHLLAVAAMKERGIDIRSGRSKSVNEFANQEFDLVVTVCDHAKDACPVFSGAKDRQHWPFDDPADAEGSDEDKMLAFRRVRDQIEQRIGEFLS